jgi:hypothetical protein
MASSNSGRNHWRLRHFVCHERNTFYPIAVLIFGEH